MRLAIKVLVGVFAVIGVAYTALLFYAYLFVPHCTFAQTPQAVSPDGKHFAVLEQSTCEDVAKSWSRVVLGARASKERFVVVEGRGTPHLALTWDHSAELVVSYPPGTVLKQLGTDGDWPRVTLRRSDE